MYLLVESTLICFLLFKDKTCQIYPDEVFLTVTRVVKPNKQLPETDHITMEQTKVADIKFLIDRKILIPIRKPQMMRDKDFQNLKWVRAIKENSTDAFKNRHRARLVSASHLSVYRHSIHGNVPTIALSSCHIFISILPSWMELLPEASNVLIIVAMLPYDCKGKIDAFFNLEEAVKDVRLK